MERRKDNEDNEPTSPLSNCKSWRHFLPEIDIQTCQPERRFLCGPTSLSPEFGSGSKTGEQSGERGRDIWSMPVRTSVRADSDLSSMGWCSLSPRTALQATAIPPTITGPPRCPPPPSPRGLPGVSTPPSCTTNQDGLISTTACQQWASTWAACSRPAAWTAPRSCQVSPQSPRPWRAPLPLMVATHPQPPLTTQCTRTLCQCTRTQCQCTKTPWPDTPGWHLQLLRWD